MPSDYYIQVVDTFFVTSFAKKCPPPDDPDVGCQELNFGSSASRVIEDTPMRQVLYAIRPAPNEWGDVVDADKIESVTLKISFSREGGGDPNDLGVDFKVQKITGKNDWQEGWENGGVPGPVGSTYQWLSKGEEWASGGLLANLTDVCAVSVTLSPEQTKSVVLCEDKPGIMLNLAKSWLDGSGKGLVVSLKYGGLGHLIEAKETTMQMNKPVLMVSYCN